MSYTIEKGKIKSENSVPYLPRWFCDDLVTFEIDKFGISKAEYFNRKTNGSEKIFIDDMWGGMRFYIEENGYNRKQNLKDCEIMPYGYNAEWHYKESIFEYEQRVLNNTICTVIKPVELKNKNLKFAAEFYDSWRFIPFKHGDFRYIDKAERVWNDWTYENNELNTFCVEGDINGTYVTIKCKKKCTYMKRALGFTKNIIRTNEMELGEEIIIAIAFDDSKEGAEERAEYTVKNYKKLSEKQNKRYDKIMNSSPILESPYTSLNNFFKLAPLYHESCKIPSVPGGLHAKTEHYWIWGWDGMTSSFAYAYWGDVDFINDMLRMYMDTADKNGVIGHWFARDMSHIEPSPIPAQGFYLSLLYQYHLNGGDISEYYGFAKSIFETIAKSEACGIGLCRGYSLIPDFRETILENGNDLSAFNNSSLYCAVCAMKELAETQGDIKMQCKAAELAEKMKVNFPRILFDEEKGFFVSSADAVTLEKRKVFMSPSIKWDNLFCRDLITGKQKQLLEFFEKNFVCECGIMYAPVWGVGYDEDANQMHCYWPANSECFARLANFENRKDLIEKLISWVECWTDILMCPEGIDCYDNVNEPKPDAWNSENGTWQAYSLRAWYEVIVHSVVGIDFAGNGMNIYPYSGEEMNLKNLHYNRKVFDIYMKGSGTNVNEVILNGKSLGSVRNIPMNSFKDINSVEIIRK